ncbi:MAG: hypothetical protein OHK0013_02660 [Sandaracinaceae bacterium]
MLDIPEIQRRSDTRKLARVRCEAVAAEGFRRVGGTLRDLSDTGMLLESEVDLAPGEELYLSFQAPRTKQWVGLVARVVRTSRPHGVVCMAGLRIEEMDAVERSILLASVERLPPRPARRRAPRDYAAWVAHVSGTHAVAHG